VHSSTERAVSAPIDTTTAEPSNPAVELVNVCRRFGEVAAVTGISLSVRRGEFFSLLGPSGCGKTTLLRLIAGLDLPDSGTVIIDGREAAQIPAHRRPVNTVFQSYALFPHLNVRENVAFGLRMKKIPSGELERRTRRVMELVQITELAGRQPSQLSGGQKQRVALARAIVNEPQVLLLDEPLGALDLQLRKELQVELHALQRRLGITFILVTHDQEEALAMSDRVGVMNAGSMEQVGPVEEVYERPRTRFVAQFLGSCNLLAATVEKTVDGRIWVQTSLGAGEATCDRHSRPVQKGETCTLAIRPEKVRVSASSPNHEPNCYRARVVDLTYTGSETQYRLEAPGVSMKAWVMNAEVGSAPLRIGQEAMVQLPPAALVILDD